MANKRVKDLLLDTDLDGSESLLLDSSTGTRRVELSTLIAAAKGAPGSKGIVSDSAPDNAQGANGDWWWRSSGEFYVKETGSYVFKFKVLLASTTPEEPPPEEVVESDDGTVVPDDAEFIVTASGDDFRLGVPVGDDFRVVVNGTTIPFPFVAAQLEYFQAINSAQRDVYALTSAGAWYIWTGLGTGSGGLGFTPTNDPHPVDEVERDPTIPVAIQPSGAKVYRFATEHADAVDPYVIASFNASNPNHDTIKGIDQILTALGKTAADIVLSTPGTPAARLTITGTDFQIDFTAVTLTDAIVTPSKVYDKFGSSVTANAPTYSLTVDIPSGYANTYLEVAISLKDTENVVADLSGVTFDGNAMTRITAANQAIYGTRDRTSRWGVIAPASGTKVIVATPNYVSGAKKVKSASISAVMFKDVNQSTPVGANVGLQGSLTNAISIPITTLHANSLLDALVMIYSQNTNPVTPGNAVPFADEDVGNFDNPVGHGVWRATKAAPTAGATTVTGTMQSGSDSINASVLEIRGLGTTDTFDIGPYASTNVAGGGPDIATDAVPADWPVPDGTGLDSGGDPDPAPTPSTFWAGVLESHGFNSDLGRSWNDAELAGFRAHTSAFRLFGFARPAPYSTFATDTQNIDLIERAMAKGFRVMYCPFTSTPIAPNTPLASFPSASNTSLVNSMGARLAEISAIALSRAWSTDLFVLEMFNEALSPLGQGNLKTVMNIWVPLIRAQHPDLWLGAMGNGREGTAGYEPYYKGWLRSGPLTDPRSGEHRIAYGHHQYDPFSFTHQGTTTDGSRPTGIHYPTSGFGLTQIRAQYQEFRAWANAQSVQIYCGETGAARFAPSLAERLQYVADVFQAAKESAIPQWLWCDDTSNSGLGNAWFTIMQGSAGAAVFTAEWAAKLGQPGA